MLKGRERREIMIELKLFIRILQPYVIVFRKKWKAIWKILIRCWTGNLNLSENKKRLRSIINTIIFLRKQGLVLRGHRDDSQDHPDV